MLKNASESSSSYDTTPSSELSEMINLMCVNNYANTKKLAKLYIRDLLNKTHIDDITKGLKQIKSFLSIKD